MPPDGYFQRVREICDRYGILLVSDEVICAYGRLGTMFGCERLGYQPDIITSAKGLTSGYAPLGAMLVSDRLAEPFADTDEQFLHGYTFAATRCRARLHLPTSTCSSARTSSATSWRTRLISGLRSTISAISRSSETSAAWATSMASSWSRILKPRRPLPVTRRNTCCGVLIEPTRRTRVVCRADARGEPVIQLSPPLIAGPTEFDTMNQVIRQALTEAMAEMEGSRRDVEVLVDVRVVEQTSEWGTN